MSWVGVLGPGGEGEKGDNKDEHRIVYLSYLSHEGKLSLFPFYLCCTLSVTLQNPTLIFLIKNKDETINKYIFRMLSPCKFNNIIKMPEKKIIVNFKYFLDL